MIPNRWVYGFFLVVCGFSARASEVYSVPPMRPSQPAHQVVACREGPTDLRTLWSLGIVELGMTGILFSWPTHDTNPEGLPATAAQSADSQLTKSKVTRLAAEQAKKQDRSSFTIGRCSDSVGYGLFFESATPLPTKLALKNNKVQLPVKALKAQCQTYQVAFAPAALKSKITSSSQTVAIQKDQFLDMTKLEPPGSVSLTCLRRDAPAAGPVLLALWPFTGHLGPTKGVDALFTYRPESPANCQTMTSKCLLAWINGIRSRSVQQLVSISPDLQALADQAVADSSIRHDRPAMAKAGRGLKALDLIGEDRVQGHTLEAMLDLLWFSPKHRDLLLDTKATHIGIGWSTEVLGATAVIMTGAEK